MATLKYPKKTRERETHTHRERQTDRQRERVIQFHRTRVQYNNPYHIWRIRTDKC